MVVSKLNGIPVLVTGGCGFIGSHLTQELVALGAHVTVIDDLSNGSLANIQHIRDQIRFIQASITDLDACLKASENQQIIFHLAALISVAQSVENPLLCHSINVNGTLNLLHAAYINQVKRMLLSSSAAVYGNTNQICYEDMQCNPQSPYGFSKRIAELLCQQYSTSYKLETIILRYFNVYGPRQKPDGPYAGAIAKFNHQMKHNLPITIYGDGLQTRDFIHVDRVVQANITLAIATWHNCQVYNIASGTSKTLLEIIQDLKQEYPHYAQPIQFAPARPCDLKHSQANCAKFNEL